MRKLIYAINLTMDGCCDHSQGLISDDLDDSSTNLLREADTFLFGRKTYQLMVPYWPDIARNHTADSKGEDEFAQAFAAMGSIVVFSRSLERVEEKNARIVRTNLREEVLKLKRDDGKNILTGGVDIPSQLLQFGLIDEFRITIQPLVVGEGRRLWDGVNLEQKLLLKLVDSKVFPSGCVFLRYVKKGA